MFRLISIVLIVLGLSAAAFGGLQMFQASQTYQQLPKPTVAEMQPDQKKMVAPDTSKKMELEDNSKVSIASADPNPMQALRTVPIAHETPGAVKFGRPFDVTVAIDATGDEAAADALPGRGNVVEGTANVSTMVQAAVAGEAFKIEAVTPMKQTVSPFTENVFRWRVTPLETGQHDLTIELFALNENGAMPVRTFRGTVEVQVSRVGQAIAFASSISPLAMVIGGIGSLIGGLFGAARFFRARGA